MVSGDSLRGMRKISLEWLSKARSGAGWVLREYRLIVAFVSGGIFLGKAEGIEKGRRERTSGWLEGPSRCGKREGEEEEESGCGKVGS